MKAEENMDREFEKLEQLEAELRKLGTPYVSPEPDAQYWASFRVRAMERIEEQEHRKLALSPASWITRAKEWIAGHAIGSGVVGAALASVIALAVINPSTEQRTATHPSAPQAHVVSPAPQSAQPEMKAPAQTATPVAPELAANAASSQHPNVQKSTAKVAKNVDLAMANSSDTKSGTAKSSKKESVTRHTVPGEQNLALMANAMDGADESMASPTLAGANADEPVSLDELSAAELESVLSSLTAEK